ncbi:hypothetical protein ACXWYY_003441 [Enterobacter hormaechei]
MNREKIEAAVRNYVKTYGIDNICRDDVIQYIEATGCFVSHVTADSITVAFPESGETTLTGYVYSNRNVKENSSLLYVLVVFCILAGGASCLFSWVINWKCIPVSKHDTALMLVQLTTAFLDSVSLLSAGLFLLIAAGKRLYERRFYTGRCLGKTSPEDENAA